MSSQAIPKDFIKKDRAWLLAELAGIENEMRRFLANLLHNSEDVKDVMQEVYTTVTILNEALIANIQEPRSYLFTVAQHKAYRSLKKQSRDCNNGDDDLIESESYCTAPDTILEAQQRAASLREAIENMPAKRRQVFLLYRFCNLTVREIAHELDMSHDAVEKNIVRALAFCREWLQERGL